MRNSADVTLRFANEEDLLNWESKLDLGNGSGVFPRTDRNGNKVRDWEKYLQRGMNELSRRLRSRKDTAEPMELGRLDPRSKDRLRDPAACFSLHFLFVDMQQSDDTFLTGKADYYWRLGGSMLESESLQLDYDSDNSGTIDVDEKNQSFPSRFIRG